MEGFTTAFGSVVKKAKPSGPDILSSFERYTTSSRSLRTRKGDCPHSEQASAVAFFRYRIGIRGRIPKSLSPVPRSCLPVKAIAAIHIADVSKAVVDVILYKLRWLAFPSGLVPTRDRHCHSYNQSGPLFPIDPHLLRQSIDKIINRQEELSLRESVWR